MRLNNKMLKRKFKYLSKSQKNRRLKELCNSLDNNRNDINSLISTFKSIKCGKTVTKETTSDSEFQDDKFMNYVLKESNNKNTINIFINNHNDCESNSIDENQVTNGFYKNVLQEKSQNFNKIMARWVCNHGITHEATGALLKILRNAELDQFRNLPLDPRTLLGTPKSTIIRSVPPGEYFHYGLKNALTDQLRMIGINKISHDIQINVNIDGLPIAKSSKSELYPILGEIYPKISEPFVIGAYHGYEKPNSCNTFLREFIDEYNILHRSGFNYCNQIFTVTIRAVICDSPARSFITCTKGHNGYFGCGKCREEGNYYNHCMLFLNSSAALRTDENFIKRIDENHHTGTSLFEEADLGMVSQFPLDYMHLVCLGAVKKILQKDRTIVRIKNICLDHDEKPILIGELLMNSVAFPNYPIDSKEFDIAVGNQWSQQTIINANNVSKKAVCISYNKSYCFLPLLHSSN